MKRSPIISFERGMGVKIMNTERKPDAILELMDGRYIHAELVRPFTPDDNEILVKPEMSDNVQRFFLAKVCCVLMKPDFLLLGKEQYAEEVVTSTGKIYHIAVLNNPKSRTGFYTFQSEVNSPYRLIFFTNHGVMSRKRESFIGEILRKEELADPETINDALKEQKRLRERRLGDIISEEQGVVKKSIEKAIETSYRGRKGYPPDEDRKHSGQFRSNFRRTVNRSPVQSGKRKK
jgi:hypothetical protein